MSNNDANKLSFPLVSTCFDRAEVTIPKGSLRKQFLLPLGQRALRDALLSAVFDIRNASGPVAVLCIRRNEKGQAERDKRSQIRGSSRICADFLLNFAFASPGRYSIWEVGQNFKNAGHRRFCAQQIADFTERTEYGFGEYGFKHRTQ